MPWLIATPLNAAISADLGGEEFAGAYAAAASRWAVRAGRRGGGGVRVPRLDDASFIPGAEIVIDGGQLAVM